MAKLKQRTIYDKNHYKAQTILRDPWFIEKIDWLKKRFTKAGCPVPARGFRTYAGYLDWNKKFWKCYADLEKSAEFVAEKNRITDGKKTFSVDEFNQLEKFREDFLPPIYGQHFDEILEHYGIDRKNEDFRNFLEYYIFLGYENYPNSVLTTRMIRDPKTRKLELFVQIFGYTKKEDIMKNWSLIAREQKHLPDFLGKSKEWKNFDRDMEIYNLYKECRSENSSKGLKRDSFTDAVDKKIYHKIRQNNKSLTMSQIRNIVSKTKKRLGEI